MVSVREPPWQLKRSPSAAPTTGTCTCATARCCGPSRRYTARQFARRDRHAEPDAAGDHVASAAAYRERIVALPAGPRLRAADDLLPDRRGRARRDRARLRGGRLGRRQALSGRRHHQLRARRHRHRATSIRRWSAMQQIGMPLLRPWRGHRPEVDVFDREAVFIDRVLSRLVRRLPGAQDRVRAHHDRAKRPQFVRKRPARTSPRPSRRIICIINRNALFAGGLRPHAYCLPVAKREKHRLAVRKAATSGLAQVLPRHRQRAACAPTPRNPRAAAPASSTRRSRSKAMRRCSRRTARSTSFEAFAVRERRRASTACRSTRRRSRWSAREYEVPERDRRRWCRSTPARLCGWQFVG